jgi:hypothetical protein
MKIAFVGQPEYFRIFYRDMIEYSEHECVEIPIKIAVPATYSALIGEEFDIIFFFRGEFCPEQVLKNCTGLKVAINTEPMPNEYRINAELEHRFRWFANIKDLPFDYIFHYDKTSIQWLLKNNIHIDGEFYLPPSNPYPPEHRDYGTQWDVSFFGRSNEWRESLLGGIKRDFNLIHIAHGMPEKEMQFISQHSRIALNLNTNDEPSLNPRLQILMTYGNLVLSEHLTHYDVLKPNQDFLHINHKNIYDVVRRILNNEKETELKELKMQGMTNVMENLNCIESWDKLIKEIK